MKRFFLLTMIFCGFCFVKMQSQSNINIKLNTLTYQFSDNNVQLAKLKLSNNGKLAFEPGVIFAYEAFATPATSLKINMALLMDKAGKFAGFPQFLIRFRLFNAFKHSMTLGLGPAFYFRQTWANITGYEANDVYTDDGDWQFRSVWFSGELEYNYYLTKMSNLSVSLNLINPESIGLAIGYKYWISKKSNKRKRGCISCPSFH
ncbi:MAG: hypothetical protein L3J74_05910 [Bacteroidales bacterium]|nr:hypothetical protein [Bacteroidales bacterium]